MRTKFLAVGALIVIAGTLAWHAREGSAAALHEKSGVTVSGINDRGQVVGTLTRGWVSHGFVWAKGSLKLTGLAEADAINDRGEILGKNGNGQNVLWENGRAKRIGLGYVFALNDRGQVLACKLKEAIGCGSVALWTDGKNSLLPFDSDLPVAMNDQGQVVGLLPDGDAGEWQGGKVTDLGPGDAIAINDRGEILGTGPNGDVTVWRNGIATDIGPGNPVALNERGQVIGTHEITARIVQAFLWSNGTTTDLGRGYSIPTAISKSGQVVGFTYALDSPGLEGERGFVWQNGTMTRLPSPKGHAGRPTRAVAINDHNQIVGDDCDAGGGCTPSRGNGGPRGFAVLWILHGRRITTLQIAKGHS
jgi:probable HAF family extracellular repeat protein